MPRSESKKVLNIHSLKHLALQLQIPLKELMDTASNKSKHYSTQETPIYKEDGTLKKIRTTYNCNTKLERILKAVDRYLLNKLALRDAMHGSRKGHSNITNAKEHLGKPYIMNLDIKDFFPSITANHVFNLFRDRLNCSTEVARFLSKLCTDNKKVPQGFNTSSSIANLVLIPAIAQMEALCKKLGLTITIQVDDITISGFKNPEEYEAKFEKIINACGFQLHPEKRSCCSNKEKQVVTGVVVNRKLNLEKDTYKDLRAKLHLCKKYGPSKFLMMHNVLTKTGEQIKNPARLKSHLKGKLNYLKQLNPMKATRLGIIFEEIQWEATSK